MSYAAAAAIIGKAIGSAAKSTRAAIPSILKTAVVVGATSGVISAIRGEDDPVGTGIKSAASSVVGGVAGGAITGASSSFVGSIMGAASQNVAASKIISSMGATETERFLNRGISSVLSGDGIAGIGRAAKDMATSKATGSIVGFLNREAPGAIGDFASSRLGSGSIRDILSGRNPLNRIASSLGSSFGAIEEISSTGRSILNAAVAGTSIPSEALTGKESIADILNMQMQSYVPNQRYPSPEYSGTTMFGETTRPIMEIGAGTSYSGKYGQSRSYLKEEDREYMAYGIMPSFIDESTSAGKPLDNVPLGAHSLGDITPIKSSDAMRNLAEANRESNADASELVRKAQVGLSRKGWDNKRFQMSALQDVNAMESDRASTPTAGGYRGSAQLKSAGKRSNVMANRLEVAAMTGNLWAGPLV